MENKQTQQEDFSNPNADKITPTSTTSIKQETLEEDNSYMKKRNIIKIDLSGCKNWKECEKAIELITSGKVKINLEKL